MWFQKPSQNLKIFEGFNLFLKTIEGFEKSMKIIDSIKHLGYFWKWCRISICVHGFNPKLHVTIANLYIHRSLIVEKMHLYGAETMPSKTIEIFENLWKTLSKKCENLRKNIVPKVEVSKILQKPSKQRLLNLLTLDNLRF